MIVMLRMLFALGGARVTGRRARVAHLGGERSSAGHHPHGRRARIGTITVQSNAHRHYRYILLVQTGICTHFTSDETLDARFKTRVICRTRSSQVFPKFDRSHRTLRQRWLSREVAGHPHANGVHERGCTLYAA